MDRKKLDKYMTKEKLEKYMTEEKLDKYYELLGCLCKYHYEKNEEEFEFYAKEVIKFFERQEEWIRSDAIRGYIGDPDLFLRNLSWEEDNAKRFN